MRLIDDTVININYANTNRDTVISCAITNIYNLISFVDKITSNYNYLLM